MRRGALGLLFGCFILFSSTASAAMKGIASMSVTGGSLNEPFMELYPTLIYMGPDTNLTAGYIGSGVADTEPTEYALDSLMVFALNGFTAGIYTAAANLGDIDSPAGSIPGGSVPSGWIDTNAGTLTLDISSFFVNWGWDWNMSPWDGGNVTGSWDAATGVYDLHWSFYAPGGGFGSNWNFGLTGIATAVPEPSTNMLWMAGIGLLIARSKHVFRADSGRAA